MTKSKLGHDSAKWMICKRSGMWLVIAPLNNLKVGDFFATGEQAFAAYAAGGRAL